MTVTLDRSPQAVLQGAAAWMPEMQRAMREADARRSRATYHTGAISEAAWIYLRALTAHLAPAVAIEIGTFIGTSTFAIHAGHVYTCDKDNACVESTPRVTCYPKTRSTTMLADLVRRQVECDFFFFDGRIQVDDLSLILRLSTPRTVYAFDDYEGHEKGVINIDRLAPWLKGYRLIAPPTVVGDLSSRTTIAALVPA